MTQKDKNLLLKDLCARLPYGVMVHLVYDDDVSFEREMGIGSLHDIIFDNVVDAKPYLRPLSSMTDDEREEIEVFIFNKWYEEDSCKIDKEGWIEILANYDVSGIDPCFCSDYVDWLNAHHFDYRGLIEKDLALEALKDMYKNE